MVISIGAKAEIADIIEALDKSDEKKRRGIIASIGRKITRVRRNKKLTDDDKAWLISEYKKIGR